MFRHATQNINYWQDDFVVTSDDLAFINNLLLEREEPLELSTIVRQVIQYRIDSGYQQLRDKIAGAKVFDPAESYSKGDALVFPALDFIAGKISGIREGDSPEYGKFDVIQVSMGKSRRKRSFASNLQQSHPLTQATADFLSPPGSDLQADDIFDQVGDKICQVFENTLSDQDDVVKLFGQWFLRALVTEVSSGHLNIAEAILDISGGGPMSPSDLLKDLDLPSDGKPELLIFSLNYALHQDERFDEVGPSGEVAWYLKRLEPDKVQSTPSRLQVAEYSTDEYSLTDDLQDLAIELDDEWSPTWKSRPNLEPLGFVLTAPHWKEGTLPLTSRIAPIFPTSIEAPRIRCTFIDAATDQEMEAWVVWEGRYVYGLENWYRENNLPIGAIINVMPGPRPGTATIHFEPKRPQQEWVRIAAVETGNLKFGMRKRSLGASYDHMMMIDVDDVDALDKMTNRITRENWSLNRILSTIFPELARLSPQSTVHSRTLYSAINLIYRCPPEPIFAELSSQPQFVAVGDNYWRYDASLKA